MPEEPSEDEEEDEDVDDDGDEAEEELSELGAAKVLSDHRPPRGGRTTPITFFTAVGIARWMARAYGYVSKKKALYKSQDKVSEMHLWASCRKTYVLVVRTSLFVFFFFVVAPPADTADGLGEVPERSDGKESSLCQKACLRRQPAAEEPCQ